MNLPFPVTLPYPYPSSHSKYTKRSIAYIKTLRISRLCTKEKDFRQHRFKTKSWFMHHGYSEKLIDSEMGMVVLSKEKD